MGYSHFLLAAAVQQLTKREGQDADEETPEAGEQERNASWSLLILIVLMIVAFFTSYVLQSKRIQAIHETVLSIFAGMVVGLILRTTEPGGVLDVVTFDYQFFFNLLLPPIILASGYELHQGNFFRNIGTILTFAFAGTFISALVLGIILFVWTRIPIEGFDLTFVDAMSVGATLSATDPVTILAIFNAYKVDPKLYTIIFGESILNDAIAIVLFDTARGYREGANAGSLTILSLFESIGTFLLVFFGSLIIGIIFGLVTSLALKFTHVRRDPKIESCLIILIAYASYFFANAITMSGIVALLFCGICLKHYAYHNMSRRTQLTTKFTFALMAQLTENFIFIYLGLSLFTDRGLEFKPLFILVTIFGVCVARWCAVFPLSALINWVIRYRAKRRGQEMYEEIPFNWQVMLFWAGLRGAVGVALAAGLTGKASLILKATVLVTVVLTVIIFGGTTSRMLEIMNIRTGVIEEIGSDDEFDIEPIPAPRGAFRNKNGTPYGHLPKSSNPDVANGGINLGQVNGRRSRHNTASYSSGNINGSPYMQPDIERRNSSRARRADHQSAAEQGFLHAEDDFQINSDDDNDDLDLPPAARRSPHRMMVGDDSGRSSNSQSRATPQENTSAPLTARGAFSQFLNSTSQDAGTLFSQLDQNFLKPHLLLDPEGASHRQHEDGGGGSQV